MPIYVVSESYSRDLIVKALDADAADSLEPAKCEVLFGEGYTLDNRCVSEAPSIVAIAIPHHRASNTYFAGSLDPVTESQRILEWTEHDEPRKAIAAAEKILSIGFGEEGAPEKGCDPDDTPEIGRADLDETDIVSRLLHQVTIGTGQVTPLREEAAAEITRLRDALFAADWALMEMNGCFPLPHGGRDRKKIHRACCTVRAVTGEDHAHRNQRAEAVLSSHLSD